MRAAIIETPGKIRVGTISDPTPKPDELVILLLMVTLHWHTILSSQVMSSRAR